MLINAFNLANEKQRSELSKWIDAQVFERNEKVQAVTTLYDEIGIRQLCEQKIDFYYEKALHYLEKVKVSEERKSELRAYAAAMMKRQS
jgi:geranylgeranyl diphosphate synthase type II